MVNNILLILLLRKYRASLSSAIDQLENSLPDSLREKTTGFLGNEISIWPILDNLYELRYVLDEDIRLSGSEGG